MATRTDYVLFKMIGMLSESVNKSKEWLESDEHKRLLTDCFIMCMGRTASFGYGGLSVVSDECSTTYSFVVDGADGVSVALLADSGYTMRVDFRVFWNRADWCADFYVVASGGKVKLERGRATFYPCDTVPDVVNTIKSVSNEAVAVLVDDTKSLFGESYAEAVKHVGHLVDEATEYLSGKDMRLVLDLSDNHLYVVPNRIKSIPIVDVRKEMSVVKPELIDSVGDQISVVDTLDTDAFVYKTEKK